MNILVILTLLLVKHYIADFILQSAYQLKNKGLYGHWGGILHALIHAVGTALVFVWFVSWKVALLLALTDGVIHYHIDWTKSQMNKHFHLKVQQRGFWYILGCDQLMHQLTYVGLVFYVMLFYTI